MSARAHFSAEEARRVGAEIGIDWDSAPFDIEQFRSGMDVELEHGRHDPVTNVTDDDPVLTGKDRARASKRVRRLLHAARADGGAGQARARSGLMLIEHRGVAPSVAESAYIAPTAVVCGDVEIGEDCRIMFGAVLVAEALRCESARAR